MASALIVRGSTDLPTATWEPISDAPLIASGLLRIKPGNTGTVSIRWSKAASDTAVLAAGGSYQLMNVDLAEIELQGSAASQGYEFVGDTYRGLPG